MTVIRKSELWRNDHEYNFCRTKFLNDASSKIKYGQPIKQLFSLLFTFVFKNFAVFLLMSLTTKETTTKNDLRKSYKTASEKLPKIAEVFRKIITIILT